MSRRKPYWERRSEQVLLQAEQDAAIVHAKMIKAYNSALMHVQKEIEAFYDRVFSEGLAIRHVDAAKGNRLAMLQRQIADQLKELGDTEEKLLKTHLEAALKESYTMTIFNVQQFSGVGASFLMPTDKRVKQIMSYPWSGFNFSQRIWKDKEKLGSTIEEVLARNLVRGVGSRPTIAEVAAKMDVSMRHAETLVLTESAYIAAQGTAEGYATAGIEQYEVLATLDTRTSDTCREQDGKRYNMEDMKVGTNYPPFHARCRTTTVPVIEDVPEGMRRARGDGGEGYLVPASMTYEQWKKLNVRSTS